MKAVLRSILMLTMLGWSIAGHAHKNSDSYLSITQPQQGATLDVQWDIALRDLEHAIGLDTNSDGAITWGELKSRREAIAKYALGRLGIEAIARGDRDDCPLRFENLLVDEHVDGHYAVLQLQANCAARAEQIVAHYALLFDVDPNHRGLLDVRAHGVNQASVVSKDSHTVAVNLAAANRIQQLLSFVSEGIWHIWKGYDHILFLLTLLLPAVVIYLQGRWEPRPSMRAAILDIVKVVTAFTLAHSLTLSLAVNGLVHVPSRVVESAIALTVLLGALNNLYPLVRGRRWAVAFVFGLVHGLGFASVLADLGLKSWDLAIALIGFNAGVETGQLCIVLLFVPLAYVSRRTMFYRHVLMPGGAVAISLIAAYWLFMRATGQALV